MTDKIVGIESKAILTRSDGNGPALELSIWHKKRETSKGDDLDSILVSSEIADLRILGQKR